MKFRVGVVVGSLVWVAVGVAPEGPMQASPNVVAAAAVEVPPPPVVPASESGSKVESAPTAPERTARPSPSAGNPVAVSAGASGQLQSTRGVSVAVSHGAGSKSARSVQVSSLADGQGSQFGVGDGAIEISGEAGSVAHVVFDYSVLAERMSADWPSRVQLRAGEGCLARDVSCDAFVVLSAVNDPASRVIEADVVLGPTSLAVDSATTDAPVSESSVVVGLTAASASMTGSWSATPLSVESSWTSGAGSGSFEWSYPLPTVPVGWGSAPSLSLSYSSGLLDGLTSEESPQQPFAQGWSLSAGGFIKRSFRSCDLDGGSGKDMCWFTDTGGEFEHLSLVMGAESSPMVRVGVSNEWRLESDPGWRIRQFLGASGSTDDDGEWFELTDPSGTVYSFGSTPGASGSSWDVPVFGNTIGEPCAGSGVPCSQAWQWALDRVVDPNGNRMDFSWEREVNSYAVAGSTTQVTAYTRAGSLLSVSYGRNDGAGRTQPQGRTVFTYANRCVSTAGLNGCLWSGGDVGAFYGDAAVDLECTAVPCSTVGPVFFTHRVLTKVESQSWVSGAWSPVDSLAFSLSLSLQDVGAPTEHYQLWLGSLQRTALGGGTPITTPAVTFPVGASLDNRADGHDVHYWRVNEIRDQFGGSTTVTYTQPHMPQSGCAQPTQGWMDNVSDCYPKWTTVGSDQGYGWFNKYLVGQVSQQDLVAGSPAHSVTYEYVDEPAWHYDRSTESHRTWSDWRGYGHVRVWVTGAAPVDTFSFRGMDGDYMDGAPLRSVQLTDSRGDTFVDDGWRRGLTYETQTTVAGTPLNRTFNRWVNLSGVAGSRMTRTDRVDSTLASSGGWLTSRMQYTYDGYGNTTQVVSLGDPGSSTDDSCTTITYALNTAAWIVDRIAQTELHSGSCSGAVVGRSQNLYDNLALGAVTAGNTTSARVATDATSWSSTTLSYDTAGRLTTLDGPMAGAGDAVTAGYDTTYGFARTLTNSLGHQTVTVSDPKRFLPLTVTDANAKTTTNSYDALGRVIAVWTPDDPTNGPAAVTFSYTVTATAPSKVKTSVWQDTTRRLDSWSFYDGLGQQIQTQHPGPNGGSITDFTVYNERGLPARAISALWSSATPGVSTITTPTSPVRETVQVWDGAGRPTQTQTWSNGSALSVSSTDYNGYTTTLTPPVGLASSTTVNALGRTVQTRRNTPTASATTTYTYNTEGRLLTTTDPAGSVRSNSYDWAGRLLTASDPDGGTTSNTYDSAGHVVTSVNPAGTLWFGYDTLGRPTERRIGTSTGTLRARWAFDAVGEKGLLDYSESFDAAGVRVVQTNTTGYDNRNRPTGITYTVDTRPTWTDNGFAGTYPVGFAYDKADHRTVLNYPTAGNLPAETVTTGYNATGQASTLIGAQTYVGNSTFTNEGWVSGRTLRTTTATASRAYGWDAATGRIATLTGTYNGAAVQQLSYSYDPVATFCRRLTPVSVSVSASVTTTGTGSRRRIRPARSAPVAVLPVVVPPRTTPPTATTTVTAS